MFIQENESAADVSDERYKSPLQLDDVGFFFSG